MCVCVCELIFSKIIFFSTSPRCLSCKKGSWFRMRIFVNDSLKYRRLVCAQCLANFFKSVWKLKMIFIVQCALFMYLFISKVQCSFVHYHCLMWLYHSNVQCSFIRFSLKHYYKGKSGVASATISALFGAVRLFYILNYWIFFHFPPVRDAASSSCRFRTR